LVHPKISAWRPLCDDCLMRTGARGTSRWDWNVQYRRISSYCWWRLWRHRRSRYL